MLIYFGEFNLYGVSACGVVAMVGVLIVLGDEACENRNDFSL